MAQIVGYMEDNVEYSEGPFVLVHIGGWRIEAELKGHNCPVLPDPDIYKYLEVRGRLAHKWHIKEEIAASVDFLNEEVRKGNIILKGRVWSPK